MGLERRGRIESRVMSERTGNAYLAFPEGASGKRIAPIPQEAAARFAHGIDAKGNTVDIFPIEDSPMRALSANVAPSPTANVVIGGHDNARIPIYTKRT